MIKQYSIYFAWCVAFVGTLFSLYFGEVLGLEPCHLCWYQRIALFPLAIFLGIAAYREDGAIVTYCIPLASVGSAFAIYQVLETYFPFLEIRTLCGAGMDCKENVFVLLGFITFPMISAVGFFLILMFLCLSVPKTN